MLIGQRLSDGRKMTNDDGNARAEDEAEDTASDAGKGKGEVSALPLKGPTAQRTIKLTLPRMCR